MAGSEREISTTWSEERVRKFLEEADASYQRIELPFGLHTAGTDRSPTANLIFPDDLSGKTVLDIGSWNGYFCFEALRRGANDALGIEVDPRLVERARLLADCLGLAARFRVADIERDQLDGTFDYVLCLNVLHHLTNPLAAIERLVGLTRERLVLEVASIGRRDRRKLGLSRLSAWLLARHPVLYAAGPLRSAQKFFITARAIKNVLLARRGLFARVDVIPSQHKDRYIAIAYRRTIRRLLVVAGPTAAGKSTLISRLLAGDLAQFARRLDIGDPTVCRLLIGDMREVRKFQETDVDRLILHYDFVRTLYRDSTTYERDEVLDVLGCAGEVTFLTVWTDPGRLREQLERGELREVRPGRFEGNKRHLRIWRDYQESDRVLELYRNWFRFVRSRPGVHYVVSLGDPPCLYPQSEWENRLAAGKA